MTNKRAACPISIRPVTRVKEGKGEGMKTWDAHHAWCNADQDNRDI